jgi:hypothetical protein
VVAGLKGDNKRALGRINALSGGIAQALDFRMGLPACRVIPARDDDAVLDQNGTHGGIGRCMPASLFRQRNGLAHERFEGMTH